MIPEFTPGRHPISRLNTIVQAVNRVVVPRGTFARAGELPRPGYDCFVARLVSPISGKPGHFAFKEQFLDADGEWQDMPEGRGSYEGDHAIEANGLASCAGYVVIWAMRQDSTDVPAYIFWWPKALFCKLVEAYGDEGGETASAQLCDAAGTVLDAEADPISLQAGWELPDGCEIETTQIIPIVAVDGSYYAIGHAAGVEVMTDWQFNTTSHKTQKKVRMTWGAFVTTESDWIDIDDAVDCTEVV